MQIMVPLNYTEFIDHLTLLVKSNVVSMTRIDDAVQRILRIKFTMGLFENPITDYSLTDKLGSQVSPESALFGFLAHFLRRFIIFRVA